MTSTIQQSNPFSLLSDDSDLTIRFPGKEAIQKYITDHPAFTKISSLSQTSLAIISAYFSNKEMQRNEIPAQIRNAFSSTAKQLTSKDLAKSLQSAIYTAQSIDLSYRQKSLSSQAKPLLYEQRDFISLYEKALIDLVDTSSDAIS